MSSTSIATTSSSSSRLQNASQQDAAAADESCENQQSLLVLASMKCSFDILHTLIQQINFDPSGASSKHLLLPPELSKHVAKFLTVRNVIHKEVEVVGASSKHRSSSNNLSDCLVDTENNWWISGAETMPAKGKGREYVEFRLCPRNLLRRLTSVHIRIPPLPQGPLSVREFRLEVVGEGGWWQKFPDIHVVDNRSGMQQFYIGINIDASLVRVVCLSNQISQYVEELPTSLTSVGFYAVRFE